MTGTNKELRKEEFEKRLKVVFEMDLCIRSGISFKDTWASARLFFRNFLPWSWSRKNPPL